MTTEFVIAYLAIGLITALIAGRMLQPDRDDRVGLLFVLALWPGIAAGISLWFLAQLIGWATKR